MSLEKRLYRLENRYPRQRTIKEMTNGELVELITGMLGIKTDELTDEYLQAIVGDEKPTLPQQTHHD